MRRKRQNGEKQEIFVYEMLCVYICTSIYTHVQGKTHQVWSISLWLEKHVSLSAQSLWKKEEYALILHKNLQEERSGFSTLLELPKPHLIRNLLALFSHSRAMSLHCVPFLLAVPTASGTCWWPCASPCMLWESESRQQYLCLLL